MVFFSKETHSGELMMDHRASPGIPRETAERMGLDPMAVRGGAHVRMRTLGCNHCGGCWVENPWRARARNHCPKCDRYMCDSCTAVSKEPDYVHRSIQELIDMVRSGKWIIAGGTASKPVLIRSTGDG